MRYRVVGITNNLAGYPEAAQTTAEFPELVSRVSDEHDLFVVDEHGSAWKAEEFFFQVNVSAFQVEDSLPSGV